MPDANIARAGEFFHVAAPWPQVGSIAVRGEPSQVLAAELVDRDGPGRVTLRDVAAAAGTSTTAVYTLAFAGCKPGPHTADAMAPLREAVLAEQAAGTFTAAPVEIIAAAIWARFTGWSAWSWHRSARPESTGRQPTTLPWMQWPAVGPLSERRRVRTRRRSLN
ncbi:hypothetical protein [Pseudarthrobacter sulfonivorans]|uniref:hypothetical protein n=1 Tax=Pseudarthrobacter sulfonivorans TaxID=121292 RepID=UPI002104E4F8|nr:hypothetical protein [Pseudarthrobacter sulfonivorans]